MPSVVALAPFAVPVPEPGLSVDHMLQRAVMLRPLLREQQLQNEERGFYSDVLHAQFVKAGFYRMLQPGRFGGYEFDYVSFFRTMLAVSRGHPSAGACLTLAAVHAPLIAAHWPERAQVDLFGADGHFAAARPTSPSGTCEPVAGGYIIDGVWTCCSGIPHSTHLIGTTLLNVKDQLATRLNFVVPRAQYTILDDWGGDRIIGMRASGSHSVRVDRQFVPDDMVIACSDVADEFVNRTPGARLHGNPMYSGGGLVPQHAAVVTPAIGAAQAALDEYRAIVMSQGATGTACAARNKRNSVHSAYGEAVVLADSAEALLIQALRMHADYYARCARSGEPATVEENLRLWGMLDCAGRLASDATELLFHTIGTLAMRRGARMLRYFSDVQMHRSRMSSDTLHLPSVIGRATLGIAIGRGSL